MVYLVSGLPSLLLPSIINQVPLTTSTDLSKSPSGRTVLPSAHMKLLVRRAVLNPFFFKLCSIVTTSGFGGIRFRPNSSISCITCPPVRVHPALDLTSSAKGAQKSSTVSSPRSILAKAPSLPAFLMTSFTVPTGSPLFRSKRSNRGKGDATTTPPTSKMTAFGLP